MPAQTYLLDSVLNKHMLLLNWFFKCSCSESPN